MLQALHTQIQNITTIEIDLERYFFFIGTKTGSVHFYEYSDEDLTNIVINKKYEIKTEKTVSVTDIKYTQKREILIGLSNGSVAVYYHDDNYPECNLFIY